MIKYAKGTVSGYHAHCSQGRTAATKTLGSFEYEPRNDGHKYLYVAVRACTADVPNLNLDMLPHEELKTAYKTFIGAYVYLNHDNTDPAKARGAIIDAVYHDEDADDRWIEILMELDEERCPKLCSLIRSGEIDTVSMGCQVESTTCSICGNVAEEPWEFCEHIQQKGREFEGKLAYEICNGINFFEESFVYDPADPTATVQALNKEAKKIAKTAQEQPVFTWRIENTELKSLYDDDFDVECDVVVMLNGETIAVVGVWADSPGVLDASSYERTMDTQQDFENAVDEAFHSAFVGMLEEHYDITQQEIEAAIKSAWGDNIAIEWIGSSVPVTAAKDDNTSNLVNQPRIPDEIDDIENDETCPLCGSSVFDGEYCNVCGYQEPPEGFDDILLESEEDYEEFGEDKEEQEDKKAYRHSFIPIEL